MSFRAEVKVYGESGYNGNALRFRTKKEAESYAKDLAGRWSLVDKWRVVGRDPSPVNYKWVTGQGAVRIEQNPLFADLGQQGQDRNLMRDLRKREGERHRKKIRKKGYKEDLDDWDEPQNNPDGCVCPPHGNPRASCVHCGAPSATVHPQYGTPMCGECHRQYMWDTSGGTYFDSHSKDQYLQHIDRNPLFADLGQQGQDRNLMRDLRKREGERHRKKIRKHGYQEDLEGNPSCPCCGENRVTRMNRYGANRGCQTCGTNFNPCE